MYDTDEFERCTVCNAVDKDISVDSNGMPGIQDGEFILPCGINDVALVFHAVVLDGFGESGLDSGIV